MTTTTIESTTQPPVTMPMSLVQMVGQMSGELLNWVKCDEGKLGGCKTGCYDSATRNYRSGIETTGYRICSEKAKHHYNGLFRRNFV